MEPPKRKMGVFPKIGGFLPKSSILIRFSIINHPFWGTIIFGNIHMDPPKRKMVRQKGVPFNYAKVGCPYVVLFGGVPDFLGHNT